ncbi:hypothetical protein Nepgr_023444 [Nepenthes gracilis]|uniref:Uncharacterized protein n=1 Tax=Nepenthes gracilis TaxID=150966 RepID=A0AAD3T3S7_NEPGR|nr:hypothetical protein Nepgr_023444 [Nepenthes gracilis]
MADPLGNLGEHDVVPFSHHKKYASFAFIDSDGETNSDISEDSDITFDKGLLIDNPQAASGVVSETPSEIA